MYVWAISWAIIYFRTSSGNVTVFIFRIMVLPWSFAILCFLLSIFSVILNLMFPWISIFPSFLIWLYISVACSSRMVFRYSFRIVLGFIFDVFMIIFRSALIWWAF